MLEDEEGLCGYALGLPDASHAPPNTQVGGPYRARGFWRLLCSGPRWGNVLPADVRTAVAHQLPQET